MVSFVVVPTEQTKSYKKSSLYLFGKDMMKSCALASLAAFSIGAGVPLLPWLVWSGMGAIVASLVLALIAAVLIGYAIARYAETSPARSIARQVAFTAVPAAITYAIGSVIGIGLT